jgi:hypothetical protein
LFFLQPENYSYKEMPVIDLLGLTDAQSLRGVLLEHANKRVAVLGPPCIGKSTILRHIPEALDMDAILFPQLSPEEKKTVFRKPWSPSVGHEMNRLARARITAVSGHPIFATVVLDVDLIVYLKISDELLRKRVDLREQDRRQVFDDVKGIQRQLEADIQLSGIPVLEFLVTDDS